MNDLFPDPNGLREALAELREKVGNPSCRVISEGTELHASTIARIVNGDVKTWSSLEMVVRYLGADPEDFRKYCTAPQPKPFDPIGQAQLNESRLTNELLRELIHLVRTPPTPGD